MAMLEIKGEVNKGTGEGVAVVVKAIQDAMENVRKGDGGELMKTRELDTLDRLIEQLDLNVAPNNINISDCNLTSSPVETIKD